MLNDHGSGSIRIICSSCDKLNELTAVNLTSSEEVICSNCHTGLGKWDALLASADINTSATCADPSCP